MINSNEHHSSLKVVGYWFNEKKSQKFGANELTEACRKRNMDFVKIDIEEFQRNDRPRYDAILHKLTALYAPALSGDLKAQILVKKFEKFSSENPDILIIDPLKSVQKLLLRVDTYSLLTSITEHEGAICTPNFVTLTKENIEVEDDLAALLEENHVTFPVVCKPLLAGGGKDSHEMELVFNRGGLRRCSVPCVAQAFVSHDAILYKIFVLGGKWFVTLRPSLKNFEAGDFKTIVFNSHHISKSDSCSPLTVPDAKCDRIREADLRVLERVVLLVREALESDLLGIDVAMDKGSGLYAIIDVNAFPSYDSVPDLMENMAETLRWRLEADRSPAAPPPLSYHPSLDMDQKYFSQDVSRSFAAAAAAAPLPQRQDSQRSQTRPARRVVQSL